MNTLPDYLAPGLDIVFVGINPGTYSARVGHYFATPRNRFWTALNSSELVARPLDSSVDFSILEQRIGLTDLVKTSSSGASDLRAGDFRQWAPVLREKLERLRPLIVCFHGVTAYRNYLKHTEGVNDQVELGLQARNIGSSRVFVVPNPSPANAAYSLEVLVDWYRQLKDLRERLKAVHQGDAGVSRN